MSEKYQEAPPCNNDMMFDPDRPECLDCGEHSDWIKLYEKCRELFMSTCSSTITINDEEEEDVTDEELRDCYDALMSESILEDEEDDE